MTGSIVSEQDGYVLTLTINNPDRRNAVSGVMLRHLVEILAAVRITEVRCVVLRGAGERAFCSGYDLSALPTGQGDAGQFDGPAQLLLASRAIADCPAPVLAAVKGACYGAGGELAIQADVRLVSDHVRLGMPPAKIGIVYPEDGISRFVQILGPGGTADLFFTGHTWDAGRLAAAGFADHVFADDVFFDSVQQHARQIAANAPLALSGLKKMIRAAGASGYSDEQIQEFARLRLQAFASDDYREGLGAMRDKRPPEFRGE